jgi:hypothetical protein
MLREAVDIPIDGTIVFDDASYAFYELGQPHPVHHAQPEHVRGDTFKIIFLTEQFRPNHRVTIRNNVDGWDRDMFGTYGYDFANNVRGWIFVLNRSSYENGLSFKFLLDGKVWIDGENRFITNDAPVHFFTDDPGRDPWVINAPVSMSANGSRFLHRYENLRTSESRLQQARFPGNHDESILYDVIIIGSGMGGGILADALADARLNTLVLDIGGLESTAHLSNNYADWAELVNEHEVGHYQTREGTKFLFGAQMALGGRSLYWSGIIPRMQDWELAFWPEPIREYLQNGGYEQAEKLMRKRRTLGAFQRRVADQLRQNLPDVLVEDLPRSRHQPDFEDGEFPESVIAASTGVFSTADLLSDSKAFVGDPGSQYLTVNLNHLVTEIRPDPNDSQRVAEVVCQDLVGNHTHVYRGEVIVLAAGSIESPKIVLQSPLQDPSGKSGVGLTDHPYLFPGRTYKIPHGHPLAGQKNHAKVVLAASDASAHNNPFLTEMLINPRFWHVRLADDDLWENLLDEERQTQVSFKFSSYSPLNDNNWVRSEGPWNKAAVKAQNTFVSEHHKEQARLFRNRVLEQGLGLQLSDFERNEPVFLPPHGGTVNHAGGTLRMDSPAGPGVVDSDLSFHAYDNLYAADMSVFPYIPTANPSLTLGALVQRLAEHIKARFD